MQLRLPVILKRRRGFGLDQHGDLRSATGHAPVDEDRFSFRGFPVPGKRMPKLLADAVMVRGDDDQPPGVVRGGGALRGLQQERPGQCGQHQEADDELFAPDVRPTAKRFASTLGFIEFTIQSL